MNNTEAIKNKARIKDLIGKLQQKLNSFEVLNLQGQLLGRIKDFTLDKSRRLYMVIPQSEAEVDSPVHLLSSQYIQKVDSANREVFVNLPLAEFQHSPLYHASNKATQFSGHLPTASISQESLSSLSEPVNIHEHKLHNQQSLTTKELEEQGKTNVKEADNLPEVLAEKTIRLLEERLLINRSNRKVGEIVIRKQIVTSFVEVPVQKEKLIIEKIGCESQQPVEREDVAVEQFSDHEGINFSEDYPASQVTQANISHTDKNLDLGETDPSFSETEDTSKVVEEEIIRLLEERLIISRRKWKVGEVVVRKEVETEIIKVPMRREKLIIDQVGSETKQLAEIDLVTGEVTGIAITESPRTESINASVPTSSNSDTVVGEFFSPKAASNLLEAIALQRHHGCAKVRIELVVEDSEIRGTYQTMFDRIVIGH